MRRKDVVRAMKMSSKKAAALAILAVMAMTGVRAADEAAPQAQEEKPSVVPAEAPAAAQPPSPLALVSTFDVQMYHDAFSTQKGHVPTELYHQLRKELEKGNLYKENRMPDAYVHLTCDETPCKTLNVKVTLGEDGQEVWSTQEKMAKWSYPYYAKDNKEMAKAVAGKLTSAYQQAVNSAGQDFTNVNYKRIDVE